MTKEKHPHFNMRMPAKRRQKLEEITKREQKRSIAQVLNDATDEKYPELKEVK